MNTQSNISDAAYGYDFVVATTQASINSGLKEYLNNANQPATALCFLADAKGQPSVIVTLDELKEKTGGVDPFQIPDATDYNDERITKLTQCRFMVGLRLKMGLPPATLPKDLPPIVEFSHGADHVTFNLFCSECMIVQNTPPGGFASMGSWSVWSQLPGVPWYFTTTVNLIYKELNQELNTPYFNNHPQEKQAIISQLYNLGSDAFSLQQLLFDLDNAVLQSVPVIKGMDSGSDAATIMTKSFINVYFSHMKEYGSPVLSVHVMNNDPTTSSLKLTTMERMVSPYVDAQGHCIEKPTPEQLNAATLDYLCMVNDHILPVAKTFNFNWINVADINNESGIIAINRSALAHYFKDLIWNDISKSCVAVNAHARCCKGAWITMQCEYGGDFTPGQTPDSIVFPSTGTEVLTIKYNNHSEDHDKSGATYCKTELWSTFDCSLCFDKNTIKLVQHLLIALEIQVDATKVKTNIFDKKITDTYTLSINQNGQIVLSDPDTKTEDQSQAPDRSWLVNLFTGVDDVVKDLKSQLSGFLNASIQEIPTTHLQNFVFPGAKTFAYKNVLFSDYQDLLSEITYVTPN